MPSHDLLVRPLPSPPPSPTTNPRFYLFIFLLHKAILPKRLNPPPKLVPKRQTLHPHTRRLVSEAGYECAGGDGGAC
jgi:hypothetical protein